MLQKDFIASGTSGVHLVLSTSVRSKRNNPSAAEHLSRTCVHLDVPEAYVLFFVTSPHIYSRTRVLLHHEFHDLQHPLLKERETGFEPATLALARRYSTTEPLAHLSCPLSRTFKIILWDCMFVNPFLIKSIPVTIPAAGY